MLSVKINKSEAVPSYKKLYDGSQSYSAVTFSYEDENVVISGVNTAGIIVGDKIRFKRFSCNGTEVFSDVTIVQKIQGDKISVKLFNDIVLKTKPKRVFLKENVNSGKWYLVFETDNRHCFIENNTAECNFDIKENVLGDYSDYDRQKKRCEGDYFLYETTFLYKATGVTDSNKYEFPNKFLNYAEANVKMYNDLVYRMVGITGNKWKKDTIEKCIVLQECVIPINSDGSNNAQEILWSGAYSALWPGLPDENGNWENISTFAIDDERFYSIREGVFEIKENVEIFLEESDIKINDVFLNEFGTSLGKKEALQEKFSYEKNEIVDYEKQIFYPTFVKNIEGADTLFEVSSITYNTYFRVRDDEWKIIDSEYWYGWLDPTKPANFSENGDPIGVLGFNDDDIYYQKKKVSKSFLRLSLYDTKDRKTQALLGYSIIFLDSIALYRGYVHFINNAKEMEIYKNIDIPNKMVVLYEAAKLGANFKTESKYSSEKTSEGFYFYLFPSILGANPEEEKEIYMKIELSNAKYGKIVPFIMPLDSGGTSTLPPLHYENIDEQYVDMPAFFEDTYIKIGISFSKKLGKYVWRFKDVNNCSNTIVINLYEPRVNNG